MYRFGDFLLQARETNDSAGRLVASLRCDPDLPWHCMAWWIERRYQDFPQLLDGLPAVEKRYSRWMRKPNRKMVPVAEIRAPEYTT